MPKQDFTNVSFSYGQNTQPRFESKRPLTSNALLGIYLIDCLRRFHLLILQYRDCCLVLCCPTEWFWLNLSFVVSYIVVRAGKTWRTTQVGIVTRVDSLCVE
jgi:hypothetical protein